MKNKFSNINSLFVKKEGENSHSYMFNLNAKEKQINLNITKNKLSKKMSLNIDKRNLTVKAVIPSKVSFLQGYNFAAKHVDWIEENLNNIKNINFDTCSNINILGTTYQIQEIYSNEKSYLDEGSKILFLNMKNKKDRAKTIVSFLKSIGKEIFHDISKEKCNVINKDFNKIILMDSKKWGSCSTYGNLRYNFRLIMAPLFVIDYICAHEVAHLQEFHHKKSFWELNQKLYLFGSIQEPIDWLKNNQNSLY